MSGSIATAPLPELEIIFDEPIEYNGKTYNSIVLREPKSVELQNALATLGKGDTPDAMFKYNNSLISAVAGENGKSLPRQVAEQMPIRKFNEAVKYLESFL